MKKLLNYYWFLLIGLMTVGCNEQQKQDFPQSEPTIIKLNDLAIGADIKSESLVIDLFEGVDYTNKDNLNFNIKPSSSSSCTITSLEKPSLFKLERSKAKVCLFNYDVFDSNTKESASLVINITQADTAFIPTPIIRNIEAGGQLDIDLKEILPSVFKNYNLSDEFFVLGTSIDLDKTTVDTSNLTFHIAANTTSSSSRLFYKAISTSAPEEVKVGVITISVSEDSAVPSFKLGSQELTYTTLGEDLVYDVSPLILVGPDSEPCVGSECDGYQLIDVATYNASVELKEQPSFSDELKNKEFVFHTDMPGTYDIIIVVSNHQGQLATGIVRIVTVFEPNKKWVNLYLDPSSKTTPFTAPWSGEVYQMYGGYVATGFFDYRSVYDYYTNIPLFDFYTASSLCLSKGGEIPTNKELLDFFDNNPLLPEYPLSEDWPINSPYWAASPTEGEYNVINFESDEPSVVTPDFGALVTCVSDGKLSGFTIENEVFLKQGYNSVSANAVASVVDSSGVGVNDKLVYFYAPDNTITNAPPFAYTIDGEAQSEFKFTSAQPEPFDVFVGYHDAKLAQPVLVSEDKVESVKLPGDFAVAYGESFYIAPLITYLASGDSINDSSLVDWTSDNSAIVDILDGGSSFSAKGVGQTTIRAELKENSDLKDAVTVDVLDYVSKFWLEPAELTVEKGEEFSLEAFVNLASSPVDQPVDMSDVEWEELPPGISAVSATTGEGKFVASQIGDFILKANYEGSTSSAVVNVEEKRNYKIEWSEKITFTNPAEADFYCGEDNVTSDWIENSNPDDSHFNYSCGEETRTKVTIGFIGGRSKSLIGAYLVLKDSDSDVSDVDFVSTDPSRLFVNNKNQVVMYSYGEVVTVNAIKGGRVVASIDFEGVLGAPELVKTGSVTCIGSCNKVYVASSAASSDSGITIRDLTLQVTGEWYSNISGSGPRCPNGANKACTLYGYLGDGFTYSVDISELADKNLLEIESRKMSNIGYEGIQLRTLFQGFMGQLLKGSTSENNVHVLTREDLESTPHLRLSDGVENLDDKIPGGYDKTIGVFNIRLSTVGGATQFATVSAKKAGISPDNITPSYTNAYFPIYDLDPSDGVLDQMMNGHVYDNTLTYKGDVLEVVGCSIGSTLKEYGESYTLQGGKCVYTPPSDLPTDVDVTSPSSSLVLETEVKIGEDIYKKSYSWPRWSKFYIKSIFERLYELKREPGILPKPELNLFAHYGPSEDADYNQSIIRHYAKTFNPVPLANCRLISIQTAKKGTFEVFEPGYDLFEASVINGDICSLKAGSFKEIEDVAAHMRVEVTEKHTGKTYEGNVCYNTRGINASNAPDNMKACIGIY